MTRKITLIAAAAAIAITGLSFTPTDAEAGRKGSRHQEWYFDSRHPVKGYEGFGGLSKSYCSYRREPQRKCWYTRGGYEKCKIVSWRLIQSCY